MPDFKFRVPPIVHAIQCKALLSHYVKQKLRFMPKWLTEALTTRAIILFPQSAEAYVMGPGVVKADEWIVLVGEVFQKMEDAAFQRVFVPIEKPAVKKFKTSVEKSHQDPPEGE